MSTTPNPNAGSAALAGFFFTFVGSAVMLLTGWLGDVASWITADDEAVLFPSMAPLVKVGVAAILALVIAGGNYAYRLVQGKGWIGWLPGRIPEYGEGDEPVDEGRIDFYDVLIVAAIVIVIIAVWIAIRR
jgi:hypothetical protein